VNFVPDNASQFDGKVGFVEVEFQNAAAPYVQSEK